MIGMTSAERTEFQEWLAERYESAFDEALKTHPGNAFRIEHYTGDEGLIGWLGWGLDFFNVLDDAATLGDIDVMTGYDPLKESPEQFHRRRRQEHYSSSGHETRTTPPMRKIYACFQAGTLGRVQFIPTRVVGFQERAVEYSTMIYAGGPETVLDYRESEVTWAVPDRVLMRVSQWVLDRQAIPASELFCGELMNWFVSDRLQRRLVSSGLRGIEFIQCGVSRSRVTRSRR